MQRPACLPESTPNMRHQEAPTGGCAIDPLAPRDAGHAKPDPDDSADLAGRVLTLIGSRHSVAPKRLSAPGPDAAQLLQMVEAPGEQAVCFVSIGSAPAAARRRDRPTAQDFLGDWA